MIEAFDEVRIVNLVDRPDRRREIAAQMDRIGATGDPRVAFFAARRPADAGPFPSIGARGCFESHLAIVREALAAGVGRLLIVEDDLDFSADIARRGPAVAAALAAGGWDMFYGVPVLDRPLDEEPGGATDAAAGGAAGLVALPGDRSVTTTACVGFGRAALERVEPFLTAMLARPAGSPDYGPMHVDGAYSVFRRLHPDIRTLVCAPPIGVQRSSRSDIAPNRFVLDRFALTRPLANALRRLRGN